MGTNALDVLETHPMTGRPTGLAKTVRLAIRAMSRAKVPYCVIGAAALAARGLPRMTRDLDLVVRIEDGPAAMRALESCGLKLSSPVGDRDDAEPMVFFLDKSNGVEVDLRMAAGEPESSTIESATECALFGAQAPTARLEYLLLLYLYSNQPRHLGDFASIVQSGLVDLKEAERLLLDMHPEMKSEWRKRVKFAQKPSPVPKKPRRKKAE